MAQRGRPSETRGNRSETLFGDDFGGDKDMFSTTDVPAEYSKNSAVVLGLMIESRYYRANKKIEVHEATRKRIKIQDKAALEEFSEFYYAGTGDVRFTIIKPNGDEDDVDMSQAVEVKTDIPRIFRRYTSGGAGYKKLAIPGLEVGDIIDYYYYSYASYDAIYDHNFSPYLFTLASSYPILDQEFHFLVDRGFQIRLNTYNGAPELVEGEPGMDLRGRVRETIRTYSLTDNNRKPLPDEIWMNTYCDLPTVKFQVIYQTRAKETEIIDGYSDDNIVRKHEKKSDGTYVMDFRQYKDIPQKKFKDAYNGVTDPEEILDIAYYQLRYAFLVSNYYKRDNGHYKYGSEDLISIKPQAFVSMMNEIAKKQDVETEVIIMKPDFLCGIDNHLLPNSTSMAIKAKNGTKVYYPFTNYSTVDFVDPDYAGTEAIKFEDVTTYSRIVLPSTNAGENYIDKTINLEMDSDFETLKFDKVNTIKGDFKDAYARLVLRGYDYLLEEAIFHDPSNAPEEMRGNKKRIAEEQRKYEEMKSESYEYVIERLEELADDNYEIDEYERFEVLSPGRMPGDDELKFEEFYTVKGLISKAGPNYVVELGKLIGKQIQLDEEDKSERETNINISSAKRYGYELRFTIPSGYNVEGIDQFNMNVDGEFGSFISSAKVEGDKLIVSAVKTYKTDFIPKESWNEEAYAFLEAGYDFTQKKAVFKKK